MQPSKRFTNKRYWDVVLKEEKYFQLDLSNLGTVSNKVALDICCGTGDLLVGLRILGYEVYGLDFSQTAIIETKKKLPNLHIYQIDLNKDKINLNQKFDLITLQNSIAFIIDKERVAMSIKEHLLDDGIFILKTLVLEKEEYEESIMGLSKDISITQHDKKLIDSVFGNIVSESIVVINLRDGSGALSTTTVYTKNKGGL